MMRSMQQLVLISIVAFALIACIPTMGTDNQSRVVAFDSSRAPSIDPGVLKGQLQNGLRYYLRSTNSAPRNDQLEVRLIVKAGSLNERPDQHGYAHLLEHMAYRGTHSFSAQDIELLLSRNGLRWGADVNATTHYDATVYRFSLTQNDVHLLPEIFKLMTEWLDSVEFDPLALENEKRIIDAELRERYADRNHIIDPVTQSAYAGSRYANQHPAGDINTIRNATVDGLKKFWKSHYRADNASLVITGSTRPWQLEPLIVSHFSKLEVPPLQNSDSVPHVVADDLIPGVRFFKDGSTVELQSHNNPTLELPQLSVNFISPLPDQNSSSAVTIENRFRNQLLFNVYSYLLRDRIDNTQECSRVALEASLLESMQMVEQVKLSVTEKNLLPCLSVAFNSVNVVSNTKLTVEEYSEFKQLFEEILQFNINQYRNRSASAFADDLVDMVTNGEYVVSSWDMQNILRRVVNGLDRETLNRLIADVSDSHRLVYSLVTNQSAPLAISDLIAAVNNGSDAGSSKRLTSTIVYGDLRDDQSTLAIPLLDTVEDSSNSSEPSGSPRNKRSGTAQEDNGETYYEWQLDNGATVLLLPDERFDHVAVAAISKGGYANRSGDSAIAARSLPGFLSVNGVDGYTSRSLRKIMEDKQLLVKPFVGLLHHGINASGRTAELPALLTMINSYFTEPMILEPQTSLFLQQLKEKKIAARWQHSIWGESIPEKLSAVSLLENYSFVKAHHELFGNVAEFDFVFVGSVDPVELQQQLVRITAGGEKEGKLIHKAGKLSSAEKLIINPVAINHGSKNTEVSLLLSCRGTLANDDISTRDNILQQWRVLSDVIAERLRYSLREELGIVYEIGSDIPVADHLIHQISFSIAPTDEDRAIDIAYGVLAMVSMVGISENELSGALARETRRAQIAGSDYQSIANSRAQQLLFSASARPAARSLPALDEINHLARCINGSTQRVTLDSHESFRPETLVDELTRQESSFQQQRSPERLR